MKKLLFILIAASTLWLKAQENAPGIYGLVTDEETGESIENAIVIANKDLQYTYTARDGFYSMSVSSGKQDVVVTAAGYKTQIVTQDVYRAVEYSVKLVPLHEMETDTQWNHYHALYDLRSGHCSPSQKQIQRMPALLTIADPVKFLQFLPGVSGGIEGLSGLYVRGGNSDQNLTMMDGLPVYGNGHAFGFLSVYNPELVTNTEFYRGVAPARYGGRAGGILDVGMKEGSSKTWSGVYNHDLLLMNFAANGPLSNSGKVTASIGLRKSWLDLLLPKGGDNYIFYNLHDFNIKITAKLKNMNSLNFWFYNGRDKFATRFLQEETDSLGRKREAQANFEINWQNSLAGATYRHHFSKRHSGNFIAGLSRYTYKNPFDIENTITTDTSISNIKLLSDLRNSITDYLVKADFDYRIGRSNHLRYGAEIIHHNFKPSQQLIQLSSSGIRGLDTTLGAVNVQTGMESSVWGEYEKNVGGGLKINAGLRLWNFIARDGNFIRPEPRILISQILQGKKALKLGFSTANQGVHRLSSVNINFPSDVWFPTTGNIRPQRTTQITGGFYQPWRFGLEFSIEGYYKKFDGVTDLTGQDDNNFSPNYWERMLAQGKGESYGLELMLIKKTGRFTGLAGYTWSYSDRLIPGINFDRTFPFRWDRRHKFSGQGSYLINKVYKLNFALVLMTGNTATVPTGSYLSADGSTVVFDYTSKNNYRMPFYRRIDLGLTKKIKPFERRYYESFWGVNIYNVAGWNNPLFISVEQTGSNAAIAQGISYTLLVPSVFYRVEF